MAECALLREDTGATLALTGTVSYERESTSRITDWPVPDRTFIADSSQLQPRRISVEGMMSDRGQTPGYLASVEDWLDEVQASAVTLSFLDRDGRLYTLLLLESWRKTVTRMDGWGFRLTLKSVRLATAQSIQLLAGAGSPSAGFATTTQDPTDGGTGAADDVSGLQGLVNTVRRLREGR